MRWIVRGDVDGFFGLALDNLVQLLLIDTLCRGVLGFPPELVYGRVLPAAAISILVGNVAYSHPGASGSRRARAAAMSARCPYGINTVSLFAHVFLVMLPAKALAERSGAADPARVAWQAGLLATFVSGIIELAAAFVAERVRKATPRAALLSTLAGIALSFISLGFLFRTFAHPVIGLITLGIVMLTYFGRVRFKGHLPGGVVAVGVGTLIAWTTGLAPVGARPEAAAFHLPVPVFGDLFASLGGGHVLPYLSVIIAMSLFNVLGSLQNIESAEAAGDRTTRERLCTINGVGSVAAALFGSAFPTTIYIGHPGWKALGARAGYSMLNGAFVTFICLTGTLAWIAWAIPIDAGMAIVLWIGMMIVDAGVPGNSARARAGGRRRLAARHRRLGSADGQERSARRRRLGAGRTRSAMPLIARVPEERHLDPRRVRTRTGLPLHRDDPLGGGRRRHRAPVERRRGVVRLRRGAVSYRTDAFLRAGRSPIRRLKLAPAWPFVIGYAGMAVLFFAAQWITEEGGEH